MWNNNSGTHGLNPNWHSTYHNQTAIVPCLCTNCHASSYTFNPMTQWYNNVLQNSSKSPVAPQDPIYGFSHVNNLFNPLSHSHVEDDPIDETDSWLFLNSDNGEYQGNNLSSHENNEFFNLKSYNPWAENQYLGQSNQLQPQGSQQVSQNDNYGVVPVQSSMEALMERQEDQILNFYSEIDYGFSRPAFNHTPATFTTACVPSMGVGSLPEATIGSIPNTEILPKEWALNQLSIPLIDSDKILDDITGSHLNANSISLEGKQKPFSRAASKKPFKYPPMSRQERVLRYFEKKKTRKYEKKIQSSSRKIYARTRPRVRGRFASSSHKEVV